METKKRAHAPMDFLLKIEDPAKEERIRRAIANFRGLGTTLGSALGALIVGQHYGTRALRMMHSPATYRKYERVLGIRFEDVCPPETPLSERARGLRWAKQWGSFWDVVMGRRKVDQKGLLEDNGVGTNHG